MCKFVNSCIFASAFQKQLKRSVFFCFGKEKIVITQINGICGKTSTNTGTGFIYFSKIFENQEYFCLI